MNDDVNEPPPPLPAGAPAPPPSPAARIDLDDPAVVEALARYDDLDHTALARFEEDPSARVLLDLLRRADAELVRGAPDDEGDFSAEELYAFCARDGEQDALDPSREVEIRRYVAVRPALRTAAAALDCAPEGRMSSFGEGLGWAPSVEGLPEVDQELARRMLAAPPAPSADSSAESSPGAAPTAAPAAALPVGPTSAVPAAPTVPAPRRAAGWVAWVPLAAAALLAAMVLGGEPRHGAHDGGLPSSPLLRSGAEAPLLFPRGSVAHSPSPSAWCNRPLFEVAPQAGAEGYRFALLRLPVNGSVFAEGQELWRTRATQPLATGPALGPGRYEWRASSVINGLEKPLGRKAFTVVSEMPEGVAAAAGSPEAADARLIRLDIRTLHAAAFLTDARHRARSLEPSPERAAYLRSPE